MGGGTRARVYLNVRAEADSTIAPVVAKVLFWSSLGALVWTQAGYPLAAAALAQLRGRPVRKRDIEPTASVIVAAHDEEDVIERRLANLLELDYPVEKLEIVVASDASTDRTDELVAAVAARDSRVRLLPCPRGGKVAAQNRAVRATSGEILAFSDANAQWRPDALRKLASNFADPDVAYVCGGHFYETADGTNREGTYWRFESWLRRSESRLGSITGGIGPIYAVRRQDYVEVDPRFGHDLALPYLMVQRGRRAVFEPDAVAWEKPSRDIEDEYRRKVRMFEHCWLIVLRGRMLRRLGPTYLLEVLSHRHLRYGSGVLHLILLSSSIALVDAGFVYQLALGAQFALLLAALAGVGLARYYVLVTWATVASLVNYLRAGVPPVWEKAEGTR
jgi:cellulose synthase/poly-beta-1,6-N-acetylglucosamine synthase-like glycosyltransferase